MTIKTIVTSTDLGPELQIVNAKLRLHLGAGLQLDANNALVATAAGGGAVYDPTITLSGASIPTEGATVAAYANKLLQDSNGATWVFSATGVAHKIATVPPPLAPFLSPVLDFKTTTQLAAITAANEGDAYIVTDGAHKGEIGLWDPAFDNGDGTFGAWVYYVPANGDHTTVTTGSFANTTWYYDLATDSWIQDTSSGTAAAQPRQPLAGNYVLPSEHSDNARRGHWLIQNTDITAWGADPTVQLTPGDATAQRLPHKASWAWFKLTANLTRSAQYAPKFVDVVGVYDAAIALDANGKVWASTANVARAGLGGMTPAPAYGFVPIPFFQALNEKVVAIHAAAWQNQFVVVTELGKVYGTGANGQGQLGDGTTTAPATWTQFVLPANQYALDAQTVYNMSGALTLVRTVDGNLYGAGYNGYSQLATGTANQLQPQLVASNVKAYASDGSAVWVVKNDGTLWVRGYNATGQLGTGNTTNVTTLTPVAGITDAAKVFVYPSWYLNGAACLLTTGGVVKFAGYNQSSKFGSVVANNANATTFMAPTFGAQGAVKDVVLGRQNTTVLTNAGAVWNVGITTYRGQGKAAGVVAEYAAWQQVALPASAVGLRLSSYYDGLGTDPESILALLADARVYVWGYNDGNSYANAAMYSPQSVPVLPLDNGLTPVQGPISLMNVTATLKTLANGTATSALDGGATSVTFTLPYTADQAGVVGVAPTITAAWGGGNATVSNVQATIVASAAAGSLVFTATVTLPDDPALVLPNTGPITYTVAFGALRAQVTGTVLTDPLYAILTGANLAAYNAAAAGTLVATELTAAEVAAAKARLTRWGAPEAAMVYTTALGMNSNTVGNLAGAGTVDIPTGKRVYVVGFVSNTVSPVTVKLYKQDLSAGANLGTVTPTMGGVHYYAVKGGIVVTQASQVAFGGQPNQFYGVLGVTGAQAKYAAGNVTTALTTNGPAGYQYGFQALGV